MTDTASLIVAELRARLDSHNERRKEVQCEVEKVCSAMREEIVAMEDNINNQLQIAFEEEDSRLQRIIYALTHELLKETVSDSNIQDLVDSANAALFVVQNYSIVEKAEQKGLCRAYELETTRSFDWKHMDLKSKKPGDITDVRVESGNVRATFASPFTKVEENALEETGSADLINFRLVIGEVDNTDIDSNSVIISNKEKSFTFPGLRAETEYCVKARAEHRDEVSSWSGTTKFTTPTFRECCVWNKCPALKRAKYDVDDEDLCVASFHDSEWAVITGSLAFPLGRVTSWGVSILRSEENDGDRIYVGVAPFDINQDADGCWKDNGWYFYCLTSTLWSGPPQRCRNKEYGPRKENGTYVRTGSTVGVVMDTTKGELSFSINNIDLGAAFEGIPLDKPLVPCVILWCYGDSIRLIK